MHKKYCKQRKNCLTFRPIFSYSIFTFVIRKEKEKIISFLTSMAVSEQVSYEGSVHVNQLNVVTFINILKSYQRNLDCLDITHEPAGNTDLKSESVSGCRIGMPHRCSNFSEHFRPSLHGTGPLRDLNGSVPKCSHESSPKWFQIARPFTWDRIIHWM